MPIALPPQNTNQGPLTRGPSTYQPPSPRGAPHGRPRGLSAWHLATCLRHTCALRGPHASCHVASVPRRNGAVVPRATSLPCHVSRSPGPCLPRQVSFPRHQSGGPVDKNTPLFRDFNKEIHLKITLKFK